MDLYIREIAVQCCFVKFAWKALQEAHAVLRGDHNEDDELRLWSSAQALLGASANLSKLFWPPRDTPVSTNRATLLKQSFSVDDNHILKDRALRNHFEHFDERLDSWVALPPPKAFVDLGITPRKGYQANITAIGDTPVVAYRRFESLWTVSCMQDAIDLQKIFESTEQLRTTADALLKR